MKRIFIVLSLWAFVFGFSQSKLTVINEAKGTPISNAVVSCNDKILGKRMITVFWNSDQNVKVFR